MHACGELMKFHDYTNLPNFNTNKYIIYEKAVTFKKFFFLNQMENQVFIVHSSIIFEGEKEN